MNTINSMGMKTSNKRENKNDHLKKNQSAHPQTLILS